MSGDRCELLCLDLEKAEALRAGLPDADELQRRADAVKAFADPTRLALAMSLRDGGECCVCDLAWIVERDEKLVSHHLRMLKGSGAVTSRRDGRMILYRLEPAALELLGSLGDGRATAGFPPS